MEVLYGIRADLYDAICRSKPYEAESGIVHVHLHGLGVPDGSTILEAACGTGRHLDTLSGWYHVAGFDCSEAMVAIARKRLPDAELFNADMCSFSVEAPYDGLICLFSSIAYLLTDKDLGLALQSFAKALNPGGALIIEPWYSPDAWETGRPSMDVCETPDCKTCRQSVAEIEHDVAIMTMHYLIAERDGAVQHHSETHRMRLLSPDALMQRVSDAGFSASFDANGLSDRGLILANRI